MARILLNYFTKKNIAFTCIILIIYLLIMQLSDNLLELYYGSNFITLFMNIIYIIFAYTRMCMIENLYQLIVQRTGKKRYELFIIKIAVVSVLVFCGLLYGLSFLFLHIPAGYENAIILFIILNSSSYVIMEIFILMRAGSTSGGLRFLILPLIVNFVFRYAIFIPLISYL